MLRLPKASSTFQSFDETSLWSHDNDQTALAPKPQKRSSWIKGIGKKVNTVGDQKFQKQPATESTLSKDDDASLSGGDDDDKSLMTYSGPILRQQPVVQFVVPTEHNQDVIREYNASSSHSESGPEQLEDGSSGDEGRNELLNVSMPNLMAGGKSIDDVLDGLDHCENNLSASLSPVVNSLYECNTPAHDEIDSRVGNNDDKKGNESDYQSGANRTDDRVFRKEGNPSTLFSPRRSPTKARRKFKVNHPVANGTNHLSMPTLSNHIISDNGSDQKKPSREPQEEHSKMKSSRRASKLSLPVVAPISPVNKHDQKGNTKLLRSATNASSESDHKQQKPSRPSQGRQAQKKKAMKTQAQDLCVSPRKRTELVRVNSVPSIKSPVASPPHRSPVRTIRKFRNKKNLQKNCSFDSEPGHLSPYATGNCSEPQIRQGLPSVDLSGSMSAIQYQVDLNRTTPKRNVARSVENTSGLPELNLLDVEGIQVPNRRTVIHGGRRRSLGAVPKTALRSSGPRRQSITGVILPQVSQDDAGNDIVDDSFQRVLHLLDTDQDTEQRYEKQTSVPFSSNRRTTTTELLKKKLKKDRIRDAERSSTLHTQ